MTSDIKNVSATTNGANGVAAITEAMQATTVQELGRKVFVGNLNFATQEDQLREFFAKHGSITEVQIIFRGTRSLGYGFVTYATTEEAEKAVAATDKTEIDSRTINVEIAKPTPGASGTAPSRAAAKATKASKATSAPENGEKKASEEDKENLAEDTSASRGSRLRRGRGRGRGRGGRSGRSRRPATESKSEVNGGEDHGASTDASAPNEGEQSPKASSRRGRGGRGKGSVRGEGRPQKVGPPEGPPSKTLLFVANLPFGLTDEGLKEFFSDYPVTSAHVVRRRYGSTVGRSKGFGFVEFDNEESQLKALTETQGKELEGRALQIKVAISEVKKEESTSANASGDAAPSDINEATLAASATS